MIDIAKLFETICSVHLQVGSFIFDEIDDILQRKDVKYLAVFLAPLSVVVERQQTTYNMQMVVLDKVDRSFENDIHILEHTRQVALDIIAEVEHNSYATMRLDRSAITLTDVKDRFNDDDVIGWIANLAIIVPNELQTCGIPYQMPPSVILQENEFPLLLE